MDINPNNRMYNWTNNQETPIMAKLDRIFVSTDWDSNFPLSRVKALEKLPSDHNPLLIDTGTGVAKPRKNLY
jgi:endonuclease/exonuclease/phosphatase family metal-dependent hydrolase